MCKRYTSLVLSVRTRVVVIQLQSVSEVCIHHTLIHSYHFPLLIILVILCHTKVKIVNKTVSPPPTIPSDVLCQLNFP